MLKNLKQEKGFYKNAIFLMLPMMLQNFVTNMMGLADTFMVGLLGESSLAAVSLANTPFFIVMLASLGIQGGASVLVAQYHGRGNNEAINRIMGVGFYVSILLTATTSLVAFFFPVQIMQILTNNAELWDFGAEYTRIVGFAFFFSSLSGMYIGVQRSMGNTKLGAIVLSISGLLNIFLNWVLIFGNLSAPKLGISGAAIATVISRVFEVIVIAIYAPLNRKRLPLFPKLILRPGMMIFKDFIKFAVPVILNELLWSSVVSIYSIIMGHMPDNTPILAAHTLTGNLDRVLSVGMFACGGAAAIIIGNEIGMGNKDSIYSKGVALSFVAFCMGCVGTLLTFALRFFFARQFVFPLMGIGQQAQDYAIIMLTIIAVVQPLRSANMTSVVGILRGGGDVKFSLFIDILPMLIACVPLAALVGLVLKWGIVAVYICMFLDDIVKFIICSLRIRSGKWINEVTRDVV